MSTVIIDTSRTTPVTYRCARRMRIAHWCTLLVRIGLGLLFLASALPKLQRPYDFLATVYGYEMLGPTTGEFVAIAVPWVELVLAVCLLSGVLIPGALLLATLLGAVFVLAQIVAISKELHIDCGCFASGSTSESGIRNAESLGSVGTATLIRAAVVTVTAATGCVAAIRFAQERFLNAHDSPQ